MEQERIIYSLNIEDVQTVASEILDRHLSTNEIAQIEDAVAERSTGLKQSPALFQKK